MSKQAIEPLTELDYSILNSLYVDRLPALDVIKHYGVDRAYIAKLLKRPDVSEFVAHNDVTNAAEYSALEELAIAVLRTALTDPDSGVKLKAVDQLMRVLGRHKDSPLVKIEADVVKYVSRVTAEGGIVCEKEKD